MTTAIAAVVGVVASLAVTGVLSSAQRNHGDLLVSAFSCALFGALIWLLIGLFTLSKPKVRGILQVVAAVSFTVGVGLAIVALWKTHRDIERPAVSAAFDPKISLLTARVSAEGLSVNDNLVVVVRGLTEATGPGELFTPAFGEDQLYLAVLGPTSEGKVAHDVSVFIPKRFQVVAVKAWTGNRVEASCVYVESRSNKLPQGLRPGCLQFRLPEETTTSGTTTSSATTTTQ